MEEKDRAKSMRKLTRVEKEILEALEEMPQDENFEHYYRKHYDLLKQIQAGLDIDEDAWQKALEKHL